MIIIYRYKIIALIPQYKKYEKKENFMEKKILWKRKFYGKENFMEKKILWKRKFYGKENFMEKKKRKFCGKKY